MIATFTPLPVTPEECSASALIACIPCPVIDRAYGVYGGLMKEIPPIWLAIVLSCERGTLTLIKLAEACIEALLTPSAERAATLALLVRPPCGSRTTVTVEVVVENGTPYIFASPLSAVCACAGSLLMKLAAIVPTVDCTASMSVSREPSSLGLCSLMSIFVVPNDLIIASGLTLDGNGVCVAKPAFAVSEERNEIASSSSSGHAMSARNQSGANGMLTPMGSRPTYISFAPASAICCS